MTQNILVNDLEFNWARLSTAYKNQFGGENYEMQVVAAADRKEELEAIFCKEAKMTEDGRISFNLKRKATKANGEANSKVRVVDAQRNELDASKIGNGSKGNVIVWQYDYEFAGSKGMTTSLTAVQVTDLVVYEGSAGSVDFDVVEASGEKMAF